METTLPLSGFGTGYLKQDLKTLKTSTKYLTKLHQSFVTLTLSILSIFLIGATSVPPTAKLVVKVIDIEGESGRVEMGLYKDNGKFPTPNKQFKMTRQKISNGEAKYTFTNLPHGHYALAIYHDENGDKVCNKNFFGVPKEAYCFSRNFRPFLSIPKFKDCSVKLYGDRMITIKMVY